MDKIEIALQELREAIFDEEIVKEYFRLKSAMEQDGQLLELIETLRIHQKAMTINMQDDEIYFAEKTQYEKYLKMYNNYPLVVNFESIKIEVMNLLNQIKIILE